MVAESADLRLHSVVVVSRHGDRYSIFPKDGDERRTDCGQPAGLRERRRFRDFDVFVKQRGFPTFDTAFPREFRPVPNGSGCSAGKLTAVGALQMIRLGSILRNRYRNLLTEEELELLAYSSTYERTFQSAVAFLYGLLAPDKENWSGLKLRCSGDRHFCVRPDCRCDVLPELRKKYEMERFQMFAEEAADDVKQLSAKVIRALGMPEMNDPVDAFDALNCRHICRRRRLPICDNGSTCITWSEASKLADYVRERDVKLVASEHSRRMIAAASAGIFGEVLQAANSRSFRYFSGHDVTLEPLLISLKLWNGTVPSYASRLVFELFKSTGQGQDFVLLRLLKDGVDMTEQLWFCRKREISSRILLCDFRDFVSFVQESYGAKAIRRIC